MIPAAIVLCGVVLLFVPAAGCNALPLAVACLWRWPPPVQGWLETRLGLGRRTLDVVGVGLAVAAAAFNLVTGGQLNGHLLHAGDFQTYWLGATVGTHYGWSRLFDESLQRSLWPALAGARVEFLPFLNPPPIAWLVVPLLGLPYAAAYGVWVALMVLCAAFVIALVLPPRWVPVTVLMSLGLWVIPYTLASGQNAVMGALAIALTWRLLKARREGWAGLALAIIDLRPTATLLVPLALLLAGYRRTFAVWLGVSAVLGAVTFWSLGIDGTSQFIQLAVDVRRQFPHAQQMTITGWLGSSAFVLALETVLVASALAAAWRAGRTPETAISAGVIASLFATPYIHYQDYVAALAAAGTVAASTSRTSFGLVLVALLAAAPPGWLFGGAWEGALLAVEIAWLAWLVWPELAKRSTRTDLAAAGQARVSE
ncbi:MAG TPA: glycosyltransferase family 87 protein [Candidatus Dormibacteraeota bacterium]|nr:glycosyltransferase family 87 protein [Candidatus Dormibacteraeota bacterium]